MKSKKHKFSAPPKELAGKTLPKRRRKVARWILLRLAVIFFVVVLLANECIALLPVE